MDMDEDSHGHTIQACFLNIQVQGCLENRVKWIIYLCIINLYFGMEVFGHILLSYNMDDTHVHLHSQCST